MAGPVASLGEAGRRAIPRLTTQGQARLSPAACMLAVCLLPPSGRSVHWALRPEGRQPLRQTWCLPSPLAGMSVPMATAQVEASIAQSWGGADKTGVGGTFGPLDLILCPLQIAGVHSHPLPDLPHGTLDLAELERLVTRGLGSPYHPVCELICLENTHSSSGGRVLPMEYLRQVGPAPLLCPQH